MLRKIDAFLNAITMYKLLSFGLSLLAVAALLLSATGTLSLPVGSMAISLGLLGISCYATNKIMSSVWRVPTNSDSWLISALILFFILPPATTTTRAIIIFLAGMIAMASKFLIAWQGKHLFNPAACAAVIVSTAGLLHTTWWVGSSVLWPFTLLFGLLVVRKSRKFYLVITFGSVCLTLTLLMGFIHHQDMGETLKLALISSPLIFLGTIMLTEPSGMPSRRQHQFIFAGLVGALYALHPEVGFIYVYPEVALLAGNVYGYIVSPKYRLRLRLKAVEQISDRIYTYVFTPDRKPTFLPGQYMEWTLDHPKPDLRGNRRTFTIASSPTEEEIRLGVKFYEPSSSYKKALRNMKPGNTLYAGQISGNFILPADPKQKLVFIAGGIGITPFRSMLKYLIDTQQRRDIVLFYLVSDPREIAYKDILQQAVAYGVRTIEVINTPGATFEANALIKDLPDYKDRAYFLSGPNALVEGLKKTLLSISIKRNRIKTDYFSGY